MEELIKALNSDSEKDRMYAVEDIVDKLSPELISCLIKRFEKEDSQLVKEKIVFALKDIDCSQFYNEIFPFFSSPDAYTRNAAVSIFGAQKEKDKAIAFLTAFLDHSDKEVRKLILDALVKIGSSNAMFAIRACLHDPAPNVQITAVEYLAKLGDVDSLEDMMEALNNNPSPMFKLALLDSIEKIGGTEALRKSLDVLLNYGGQDRGQPDVFTADLLTLIGRVGTPSDMTKVLSVIEGVSLYAEDIVNALGRLKERFPLLLSYPTIFNTLFDIVIDRDIAEMVRVSAAEILMDDKITQYASIERLDELIKNLIEEGAGMRYMAARLLARCKMPRFEDRIRQVMNNNINDEDFCRWCSELLGDKSGGK